MKEINLNEISNLITSENYYDEGKEVKCYLNGDEIIKIFHSDRKSGLPMISKDGFEKFMDLPLKHFNKPTAIIYDNDKIVGYKEKKLDFENFDINKLDINYFIEMLSEIKEDIRILSDNGFQLEDLFYNYTFSSGNIIFYDFTSYKYVNAKNDHLKKYYYDKNIRLMNVFFVGLTLFDAFKIGEKNEYTKIYKANEYIDKYVKSEYFGDYLARNISENNMIFKK